MPPTVRFPPHYASWYKGTDFCNYGSHPQKACPHQAAQRLLHYLSLMHQRMRDINRIMEREIAKGSCPLKFEHIEFGDYPYQVIASSDKMNEVLSYLLRMRKNFLKEHRKGIYQGMILTGELKAADQMGWVAKMNNIRHSAEEIVLTELIYI